MEEPYSIGITAGGKSTRFGSDKRYALFEGRSFLDHAVHSFAQCEDVLLSVDDRSHVVLEEEETIRLVEDETKGIGPIEALFQILKEAQNELVFVFPVDMPFVTKELADYLVEQMQTEDDAVCPMVEGRVYPLCAVYRRSTLSVIERQKEKGVYRLMTLLSSIHTRYLEFPREHFGKELFSNFNREEDYKALHS